MNKTKISAKKFINLIEKNDSYEVAFLYKTQSGTQIMETIINDELKHFFNAKGKGQNIPRLFGVSRESR